MSKEIVPVHHITALDVITDRELHRLTAKVAGEQYDVNTDPEKPTELAIAEAMEVLRKHVLKVHGDGYELELKAQRSCSDDRQADLP